MNDWSLKLISHRDPPVLTDDDYDNRIAELEAEIERLQKDAARYRFMKEWDDSLRLHMIASGTDNWDETLDEAIVYSAPKPSVPK